MDFCVQPGISSSPLIHWFLIVLSFSVCSSVEKMLSVITPVLIMRSVFSVQTNFCLVEICRNRVVELWKEESVAFLCFPYLTCRNWPFLRQFVPLPSGLEVHTVLKDPFSLTFYKMFLLPNIYGPIFSYSGCSNSNFVILFFSSCFFPSVLLSHALFLFFSYLKRYAQLAVFCDPLVWIGRLF